ncbi:DUF4956 domain-containing protein [Puteibacter caeruleilacunae]|nr:DUF4956 domain-containing protein [Puteibacter caeruleilacunae]
MAFFEIELIDFEDFWELLFRFGFNLLVIVTIVKYLYYKSSHRKDYFFTYILISTVIFLLCFLLENVKLELGFALGLFAIFGIIRYRTRQIPIKEMTYLFLVIGVSVINALANRKVSYAELLFTNLALIAVTFALERLLLLKHESRKVIEYEKIELIKPQRHEELIKDLEERTGIKINRVEIGKIDFLRDSARINIYYYQNNGIVNQADIAYGNQDEYDD